MVCKDNALKLLWLYCLKICFLLSKVQQWADIFADMCGQGIDHFLLVSRLVVDEADLAVGERLTETQDFLALLLRQLVFGQLRYDAYSANAVYHLYECVDVAGPEIQVLRPARVGLQVADIFKLSV